MILYTKKDNSNVLLTISKKGGKKNETTILCKQKIKKRENKSHKKIRRGVTIKTKFGERKKKEL